MAGRNQRIYPRLCIHAGINLDHKFYFQGHSPDSPLYVAVTIGSLALPTIIKMSSVMARGAGIEWTSAGELPVEIPLSDDRRFHSVFSCPVSKEQGTEENPPMVCYPVTL